MLRNLITSIAEVTGLVLVSAGAWNAFGAGVGMIAAGVSLIVVSVVSA